jgi:hypothetical protein
MNRSWGLRFGIALYLFAASLAPAKTPTFHQGTMEKTNHLRFSVVHPSMKDIPHIPTLELRLKDGVLKAKFEVFTPPQQINGKKTLGPGEFPYQFDVVEIFIRTAGEGVENVTYYETELTPYDQTYELTLQWKNGKKSVLHDHQKIMTRAKATIKENSWIGEIEIPLKAIGLPEDTKDLVGNAYVIAGPTEQQVYWSVFLPPQQKPNFHKPEHFKPLF